MRRLNGGVIGRKNIPGARTAPGIWISKEQYVNNLYGQWPVYYPGFDLTKIMNDQSMYDYVTKAPGPASNQRNIFIGAGGYRMYIINGGTDLVYQYTMNDPYNLDTLVYDNISLNVTTQESSPHSVWSTGDGHYLYVFGQTQRRVIQYYLSDPWNLSSASYVTRSASFSNVNSARSIFISPDGTKLFIMGNTQIGQYTFTNPFDPASLIYDNISLSTYNPVGTEQQQVYFTPDGMKFFIIAYYSEKIAEYVLQTPWNLVGASFSGRTLYTGSEAPVDNPYGMTFSDDGYRFYVSNSSNRLFQFSTGTVPFQLTEQPGLAGSVNVTEDSSPGFTSFSTDGYHMFIMGRNNYRIRQYYLSTPWDVTTSSYTGLFFYYGSTDFSMDKMIWNSTGTQFWMVDGGAWYKFLCWSPWDISTAYYDNILVTKTYTSGIGVFFDADGLRLYIAGMSSTVYQFELSIPYDVSTAVFINSIDLASSSFRTSESSWRSIWISPDGGRMFLYGTNTRRLYQYTLYNPWDITSAVWDNEIAYYTGYAVLSPQSGAFFKPDGTKFFITGNDRKVYQFFTGP